MRVMVLHDRDESFLLQHHIHRIAEAENIGKARDGLQKTLVVQKLALGNYNTFVP